MPTRRAELTTGFMVEISGVAAGYFKGVDGLQAEREIRSFQDGDDNFLRKLSGASAVQLQAGTLVTQDLQDWWKHGGREPKEVVLRRYEGGKEVAAWVLRGSSLDMWRPAATGVEEQLDGVKLRFETIERLRRR